MSRIEGIRHNLSCPCQGPGDVQLLEGWQNVDDAMQSALVPGSSIPDSNGAQEEKLDGCVEVAGLSSLAAIRSASVVRLFL